MFDTMMIAKRIKQARIDQNMTQMALADAMGVSYQAVSNWERGSSMPDISKLGDLCAALNITANGLLGLEEAAPDAASKAMDQEELTDNTPIVDPGEIKRYVKSETKRNSFNYSVFMTMAPFAEEEDLNEIIRNVEFLDPYELIGVAPFICEEEVDRLANNLSHIDDIAVLYSLAPFVSAGTIDRFVLELANENCDMELSGLCPFLKEETVKELVKRLLM